MEHGADCPLRTVAGMLRALARCASLARALFVALPLCLGATLALAQSQRSAPSELSEAPAAIRAGPVLQSVLPYLLVLEDPTRARSLDSVRTSAHGWSRADSVAPGFSRSVWWLRVAIDNPSDFAQPLVLDLMQPLQDAVHWYVLDRQGTVLFEQASGDRLPFSSRPLPYHGLALPLTLAPHEQREVFVRLDTHDGLFEALGPVLSGADEFRVRSTNDTLLHGLYFGALLALTLYNFLVWLGSRERGFGLYVVYALSFLLWGFTYRGFSAAWLWPETPALDNQILPIAAAMSLAGYGAFCLRYLRLSELAPRWQWRALQALVALNLLTLPLALADRYAWAFMWCIPTGLSIMVLGAYVSVEQARRGSREALLFVLSFLPMGVGASLALLQLIGLAPHVAWMGWVWEVGSAFQMLLLALALAYSLNRMKLQRLEAERQARSMQAELAAGLELKVRARTKELEAVNLQLAELSITDALTGAFNRRHFDQRCAELLTAAHRAAMPLAFCMIDIDHFKAYNDCYGHQEGDRALQAVAEAIRGRLRRGTDQLFRLGGEEFGVLFSSSGAAQATAFVEDLRLAVRALAIPHARSAQGVLTASFGLGFWAADALTGLTVKGMYLQADRLLYDAKAAGRDRVEVACASATR